MWEEWQKLFDWRSRSYRACHRFRSDGCCDSAPGSSNSEREKFSMNAEAAFQSSFTLQKMVDAYMDFIEILG